MSELRVLGIGSPFGDDQLGWEVVKLLEKCPNLNPFVPSQLQLICCDRPGMYLLELMRNASTVFLIDAVKTGGVRGTLHRFKNQEIEAVNSPLSSHALGVAYAIKMGRALDDLPLNVILYGIEISDINYQSRLSKTITQAIKTLSKQITNDIFQCLHASALQADPINQTTETQDSKQNNAV